MKHMTLGFESVSRWTTALIGALVLAAVGAVALADQGVWNSATGSGHIALWAGQPYWDSYSFTARIHRPCKAIIQKVREAPTH